jgi:hypothetical protein
MQRRGKGDLSLDALEVFLSIGVLIDLEGDN